MAWTRIRARSNAVVGALIRSVKGLINGLWAYNIVDTNKLYKSPQSMNSTQSLDVFCRRIETIPPHGPQEKIVEFGFVGKWAHDMIRDAGAA